MDVVDHLLDFPDIPIPPAARVGIVAAADGTRLRWAGFAAPNPRGTVILLQGRAEYIECFYETIRDLQARGLSVVTFDWRGQGGSQRLAAHPRKGHVADMAAYDFDLDAILRLVAPDYPKPWYVLAHSTGGLVAVANGARLARDVRRMVLTAPFLGLGRVGGAEPVTRVLARTLRAVGLGRDWVPGGGSTPIHTTPFAANILTSDPVRHARGAEMSWRHPEIAVGSPTVGWLAAAFDAMGRIFTPAFLAAWRLPTLIFSCGDDRVVSNPAIERFATRTVATEHLVVPGARHELLKERDRYREQFWAGFDAFVPGSDAPAVVGRDAAPAAVEAEPAPAPGDDAAPANDDTAPVSEATAIAALATVTAASAVATAAAPVAATDGPVEPALAAPSEPPPADTSVTPTETIPVPASAPVAVTPAAETGEEAPTDAAPAAATDSGSSAPSGEPGDPVEPGEAVPAPPGEGAASAPDQGEAAGTPASDAGEPIGDTGSASNTGESSEVAAPISGAGEQGEHPVVQPPVAAGDDAATVDRVAAVPGGDDAAGSLDHRDQGDDVVGLQTGLDHHVDEAAGDHAVGVAIDPVARQPDP